MALSDASREAIACIQLYSDLQIVTDRPPLLYSDSITALLLTDESSPYQRSKHIDTRYHYIRDILQKGEIQVDYVSSEENPADIFTKALGADLHHHCVLGMGLRPFILGKVSIQLFKYFIFRRRIIRMRMRWGFLVSMLFYRESHITRWSIYKRFSP